MRADSTIAFLLELVLVTKRYPPENRITYMCFHFLYNEVLPSFLGWLFKIFSFSPLRSFGLMNDFVTGMGGRGAAGRWRLSLAVGREKLAYMSVGSDLDVRVSIAPGGEGVGELERLLLRGGMGPTAALDPRQGSC
jgi:hypothetical protein